MQIVFNSVKMELKKELTPTEKAFVENMREKGFIFTYYPNEDSHSKEGGSIKEFSITLKGTNKIKV